MENKKELSSGQREELLRTLKSRFEKNMNRHSLNGHSYKQSWKLILKNCGRSMKWKEPAVNRMLQVMMRRQAKPFFRIVQRKVLKAVEVFVTTVKRWNRGKNINRKIMPLIWLLRWALNF